MRSTTFHKSVVTERTGRDLEGLLRELYVDKRYTFDEIGEALGVSRETVRKWALEFGITRAARLPIVFGDAA